LTPGRLWFSLAQFGPKGLGDPKWLWWTLGLWAGLAAVSLAFLAVNVAIHDGPF